MISALLLLISCRCCGDDCDTGTAPVDSGMAPPAGGLSAIFEVPDGATGTLIVELTQAVAGAETQRHELPSGVTLSLPDLAVGAWGLRAWLDEDEDGSWDGAWSGEGEPAALMGLTLPDEDLHVVLRRGVQRPILEADPQWIALHDAAWAMASEHVAAGTAENGFAEHYLDEAFSEQVFQWDTCFMTLFGGHGLDALPVMGSLDNFYGVQQDDGYICRVVNESDGEPGGDASDPSEPMINPPLFGWAELSYVQRTGDLSRLPRVLPVLEAYHDWIDASVRTEPGLYYTSMLGSGMDNAPRDAAFDGWVDLTAQQALGRRVLADLRRVLGDTAEADGHLAEAERICDDVRSLMWDDGAGWFADLDADGVPLPDKTLAGVWPLVAGCASSEQAGRAVANLADPAVFWRVHTFPSTAADSSAYDPDGHYWRGGVWAPTTFAAIRALGEVGRQDLARAASENHLRNLSRVYEGFVAEPEELSEEARGDGSRTLWELYAPDSARPGTRWDADLLGRQDFVGWTGLGPIALLVEEVIGLVPDAPRDTLVWRLARTDRHGVEGYRFGDQLVDLYAAERTAADDLATLTVLTSDPFTLVVEVAGRTWSFDLERGSHEVLVDPGESALAAAEVPAGPFWGTAILGNGRISVVYTDDDGTGEAPGIAHLYHRNHGTDLLEWGRTLVAQGGERITARQVGLDPFFAAATTVPLPDGATLSWRTFVGEDDVVVTQGVLAAGAEDTTVDLAVHVHLRDAPVMNSDTTWATWGAQPSPLWVSLTDNVTLALASDPAPASYLVGELSVDPLAEALTDQVEAGEDLVITLELAASAGEQVPFRWGLAVGADWDSAHEGVEALLAADDPLADAEDHWADWAPEALCQGSLCPVAAANLYAARASSLGGRVPADLTGQFVTAGRPQLYPRDALMVARAFEETGHRAEAQEIVQRWLSADLPRPSTGELYARYDALERAVDGGTGAAFDVPEWDSNGYLATLVERLGIDNFSAGERETVQEGLDHLVESQDLDGLWWEGGIIEWEGRLPATAMTNGVGLEAGARIAEELGRTARAEGYRQASGALRGGLLELLEWEGLYLADERDGTLQWDSSLLFGPAWGYPPDPVLDATFAWLMDSVRTHGGGVRYFDAGEPGLDAYGHDLFFFTTAAAAEYAILTGDLVLARELVEWMVSFSNRYGLAPERVYAAGHGASEASPLSWCAAELALAIVRLERAEALEATPVVDGVLHPYEYTSIGHVALDHDGLEGDASDLIAMYAARVDDTLTVGLQFSGLVGKVTLFLSDESGEGPHDLTADGQWLTFLGADPGASGWLEVDSTSCVLDDGTECSSVASGPREVELSIPVSGPVQLIAQDRAGTLLPAHGALRTDPTDTVEVTFEVVAGDREGVTLSGDREELGAWEGHAIPLRDEGAWPDRVAGDGSWTAVVTVERGGTVLYKYLEGEAGDPSWDGVEHDGDDRVLYVDDIDGSGRIWIVDRFGRGGEVLVDP